MLLGLDLGTSNVKACVSGLDGKIAGLGSVPVSLFHVGPDGVEQDIEEIWQATLKAIKLALRAAAPAKIRAIGVSSQGGAIQLLDENDRPLGRVMSWLDDRGKKDDRRLTQMLGKPWFYQRVGHGRSGHAIGQLLRRRREDPGILNPPRRIGFVGDIVVGRLCGCAAHDGTSTGLTLLYNPKLRAYDPWLLRRLRVQPSQLPAIITVREAAGGLLPVIARKTGLPAGIPVACAVHDQYAAALGSGVIHPGDVMFGAGTAWVLLAVLDRLTQPVIEDAYVCHHVVDGCYGQILSLRTGGSAVSWAKDLLGMQDLSPAAFDDAIASVPPGSNGVAFWPFVTSYGASELPASIKGQFTGLQFCHQKECLMRAVVEGLACELNRHLLFLRRARLKPKRLVMCGGAARSRVTPQIIADVTGVSVDLSAVGEAGLLGATILARGLLEPKTSIQELARQMVPPSVTVRPGTNASPYRQAFQAYVESLSHLT